MASSSERRARQFGIRKAEVAIMRMQKQDNLSWVENLLVDLTFRWPLLVGLVLAGALIFGVAVSFLPVQYSVSTNILVDLNIAEALPEIDRETEASYLSREGEKLESILYADEVWDNVRAELQTRGWEELSQDNADLFAFVSSPHPMEGVWKLVATHANERFARDLSDAWALSFTRYIQDGVHDSREGEELDRALAARRRESQFLQQELDVLVQAAAMLADLRETADAGLAPDDLDTDYFDILGGMSVIEEDIPYLLTLQRPSENQELLDLMAEWVDGRRAMEEALLLTLEEEQERLQEASTQLDAETPGISPYIEVERIKQTTQTTNTQQQRGIFTLLGASVGFVLYFAWWLWKERRAEGPRNV